MEAYVARHEVHVDYEHGQHYSREELKSVLAGHTLCDQQGNKAGSGTMLENTGGNDQLC